jgi:hypothetical protein
MLVEEGGEDDERVRNRKRWAATVDRLLSGLTTGLMGVCGVLGALVWVKQNWSV